MLRGQKQTGFTIVELLIVVVVIAILAAITVVAYNGIQQRAKNSATQSAASQVSKKIALWQIDNPNQAPATLAAAGLNFDGATTSEYTQGSNGAWCATITTSNSSYFVSNIATVPSAGGCPSHAINGIAAITNYVTNPHAVSTGSAYSNQTPASGNTSFQPTAAQDGGSAFQVITTLAGQIRIGIPHSVGNVTLGDTISVGVDIYCSVATQVLIEVSISPGIYPKSSYVSLNPGWNRVEGTVTMTATGGTTGIQVIGSGGLPAGTTWMASRAIITKNSPVYNYADGNTSTWLWNGTANNSTSKGTPV